MGPLKLFLLFLFSCWIVSNFLHLCVMQHTSLFCPPVSPRVCSNSSLLTWCCYCTISSSTDPFSFCLQSFPESGSFAMSWLLSSGGQSFSISPFNEYSGLISDGKESVCSAEDLGLIPGSGRSSGEGNHCPLQYSCLENSMDRGTFRATVSGVTKSLTRLSNWWIHILREKIRWIELKNCCSKNSSLLFSVIDITYPKSISDSISSLKFTKQFH